jgi:hypothetical protein
VSGVTTRAIVPAAASSVLTCSPAITPAPFLGP